MKMIASCFVSLESSPLSSLQTRSVAKRHDVGRTSFTPCSLSMEKSNRKSYSFQVSGLRKKKQSNSLKNVVFCSRIQAVSVNSEAVVPREKLQSPQKKDLNPVIVIDNYDSFTYNLCQYLGDLGCHYKVFRNDDITVEELEKMNPRGILISPGPGTPDDSGISLQTIVQLGPKIPIFGVCMGLQCMGQAFGGEIVRAPGGVMHGKKSLVYHNQEKDGLLSGLPNPFTACRYHSLVINSKTFPGDELEITAWTEDGLIMGVRHKKHKHIQGVQFHPESIITENGIQIVQNFINSLENFEEQEIE